jgi:ubiquinone/menaquinone biosynthesis C-methylase UbiE
LYLLVYRMFHWDYVSFMAGFEEKPEGGFEADWRARFDRFAARGGSEATVSGWSEHGLARRLRAISLSLRNHSPESGARVVDLGCGTGVYCDTLHAMGFSPVGADFSLGMLRRAQEVTDDVPLCAADLNALPFGDGQFGGLVNVGVLQHLSRVDGALGEMSRVLKPNAMAYLITLNRWSLHSCAAALIGRLKAWRQGQWVPRQHAVRRSVGDLLHQAQTAGFEQVEVVGVYLFPSGFGFLERILDRLDFLKMPITKRPLFLFMANAYQLVLRRS